MARTITNETNWAYALEASPGVLPGSPTWFNIEPNSIGDFGATIQAVRRSPISKNRQKQKGSVVDLDAVVNYDADLTMSALEDFAEGFVFADRTINFFRPTAVTSTAFTVASGGALPANTLVYSRAFDTDGNNGLKVVDTGSTGTSIEIVGGLTAEASPPNNATVEVVGYRTAVGDLDVSVSGSVVTLTSTALDFADLNATVGQMIYIGGEDSSNRFTNAANRGMARVVSIDTNALVIDKTENTWVTEANTTQTVDIYVGSFIRNVDVDAADFAVKSFQFEAAYTDLGGAGTDEYEYAKGQFCNEMRFSLPAADKATVTFGFVGLDAEPPTTTRATNAASALDPVKVELFNTSADIARLRIAQLDETGLSTDFKSLNFTIRNNVTPEKVVGTLGGKYMNYGNFEVMIEAELLFTESAIATAVRNNTTVAMDFVLKNGDGGFAVDVPAMTLGDGAKSFPVNESVLINTTSEAHQDDTLGTSIGLTVFGFIPTYS